MKIALVIERMDTSLGGRERSVAEIASELARRGHDVSVLCQTGDTSNSSVKVLPLGEVGLTRASRRANLIKAVENQARQGKYDIIHATLPVPAANVYQPRGGTVIGQLVGRERLSSPLGRMIRRITLPFNRIRSSALRIERQIVDDGNVTCLAMSKLVAGEFATYYGRNDVAVIYCGVEIPSISREERQSNRNRWRRKWNVGDDDTVFLVVAHNFVLKGVPETIRAFAQYARRMFPERRDKLVIVGRNKSSLYRWRARWFGVGEQVVFEPGVGNIFELYCAADAVVLLSWQDACSRVILEAIRMGLPSMTTRFNGAAEIIADRAGVVVESPRDYENIIAGFEKLASPNNRGDMIAACQEKAWFVSNSRQVDELEGLYQDILK